MGEFDPNKKIIEYCMRGEEKLLRDMRVVDFLDELSSDSPAPGGGSIAALCGSIGSSLAAMVANLTCGKKDMKDKFEDMDRVAAKAQELKDKLALLIDEDTFAFNKVMAAMKMKKKTDEQKEARKLAMEKANKEAAMVPFETLKTIREITPLIAEVVKKGNPASITDGGVGALMIRSGAIGAFYNIIINLDSIEDEEFCSKLRNDAKAELDKIQKECDEIDSILKNTLKI